MEQKDKELVKLFQFPSFIRAIDFVNEIAIIVRAGNGKYSYHSAIYKYHNPTQL
jgi:hypothetical protein